MLRILIWRFCFEFFSLLKVLGFRGRSSFYFAFGGNLDPSVLERRRIDVRSREFCLLKNYEIKFNHEIPFEGVGFASIERKENSEVAGVILEIPKIDEYRMDCFEACFIFQRYKKAHIELSGKNIFYYYSGRPVEGLKPTTDYLNKILTGCRLFLDEESPIIQKLKAMECLPKMLPKNPPRFLIINYERFGSWLRPFLEWYDTKCVKLFTFFIFRPSIFQSILSSSQINIP